MIRRQRRVLADINVVPYIDVMLVLLVIFMITTPLLTQGVNVDLPQATAKQLPTNTPEPMIVTVDANGHYYFNIAGHDAELMPAQDLVVRVTAELRLADQAGQQTPVLIKGDKDVGYGKVVQAMVLLQQAGVDSLGLMTQPPTHAASPSAPMASRTERLA